VPALQFVIVAGSAEYLQFITVVFVHKGPPLASVLFTTLLTYQALFEYCYHIAASIYALASFFQIFDKTSLHLFACLLQPCQFNTGNNIWLTMQIMNLLIMFFSFWPSILFYC
jgi:hypothetical protein